VVAVSFARHDRPRLAHALWAVLSTTMARRQP
jgi:hypothetical protein